MDYETLVSGSGFDTGKRRQSLLTIHGCNFAGFGKHGAGDGEMVMLGILRKRTTCSCSEGSAHWSWPFTRAHEKYHGQIVTTVTCLKHAWSVRLYDEGKMRFATFAEEQEFMQRVQAPVPQSGRANAREAMPDMITAGV